MKFTNTKFVDFLQKIIYNRFNSLNCAFQFSLDTFTVRVILVFVILTHVLLLRTESNEVHKLVANYARVIPGK